MGPLYKGRSAAAAVLLVTGLLTVAPPAPAGAAVQSYGGAANGSLVDLGAVTIPGTLNLATAQVAPADAEVASDSSLPGGVASHARGANLDATLVNGTIPIKDLVVSASQTAPPDNATGVTKQFLGLPVAPIVAATVGDAFASARWLGANCVPAGTPISHGTSTVATADVLTGTPLGSALVSVVNKQGGTVTSDSTVGLVNVPNQAGLGMQSSTIDQLTSIILFKGSLTEISIDVLAPPVITATATGTPGGAKVTYSEPILRISMGGKVIGTLDASTNAQSITIPALATLSLGAFTKTEAADGTSASGSASLLKVAIGIAPLPLNVATVTIAGASAAAHVPSGGVICDNPLREARKDVTTTAVAPGQSFNYTVTVPNRGGCTLTNVKVVDTITAPDGSTVTATDPPADSVNGLVLTWNDIGPLAPNQTKNLQITVKAPANLQNGAAFSNHADISAVCNGTTFNQPVDVSGPVGFVPPAGVPCRLSESNKASSHLDVTPGETFDYFVHVLNDGSQPCNNTKVSDTLDPSVTYAGSCSDNCTVSGSTLTWSLGTLAPGASRTLVIVVQSAPGAIVGNHLPNDATISANGTAPTNVHTDGPLLTDHSVLAPPNPAVPAGGPINVLTAPTTLAHTGGQPWAPIGLMLFVVGLVSLAWRRRGTMFTS